jgi:3-hydroxybutyryl-CoA dehydrogenase
MAFQITTPYSIRLGVVGSGTMGSGIALTALMANMIVTVFDVESGMLDRARSYLEQHLRRKNHLVALNNLQLTTQLEDLDGAGVVIEAIPEDLALKCDLFAKLDELCLPPAILATNTSTLAVTAIAAAARHPERVAGMHFFNPAPVLPLVEIVRGAQTNQETILTLVTLAERIGKTPVVAKDTPGFIVNRVARPFYGEALRLLGENVATAAEIDQLIRMSGGFKMGPFELMDLIGIDVNLAAMQSMYEQTFGEPRYRPHRLQVQMVQQQALGRKTGRGFYQYDRDLPTDPTPPEPTRQSGNLLATPSPWTPGLPEFCRQSGYAPNRNSGEAPLLGIASASKNEGLQRQVLQLERDLPPGAPLLCQCGDVTLAEIATWVRRPERLVGFDGLFFLNGRLATLVAGPTTIPQARADVEDFVRSLGRLPIWVQDSPGLVLPRIVAMLANEASFALMDGVADLDTIDKAMQLGTNYPRGPLAWARSLGYLQVVGVLDHLRAEYGEERYRASPLLRRWARLSQVLA